MGRMLDHSVTDASSYSSKPRALSFCVSPNKCQDDVHKPLRPIFSGTRDQTLSISQHIQATGCRVRSNKMIGAGKAGMR